MAKRIQNSILEDIKQMLGQEHDDDTFDVDIKIAINAAFATLSQLGVGPKEGFSVTDASTVWDAYLGDNLNLESVKSYIYLRSRLIFDPPTNSFLVSSYKEQITELEWRLSVVMDGVYNPRKV